MFSTLIFFVTISSFVLTWAYIPLREPGPPISSYNEVSMLQDTIDQITQDFDKENQYFDLRNRLEGLNAFLPEKPAKNLDIFEGGTIDYDLHFPSIRDHEYLQHNSLWGNKYMSGGGAEPQKIKGVKAQTEVKTDAILPAYCNPPNPCPYGQTAEDGCIENFENTAGFSRAYQASQECMCDTEHMFDCQPSPRGTNDDGDFDMSQHDYLMSDLQNLDGEHRGVMAKKFYNQKLAHQQELNRLNRLANEASRVDPNNHGIQLNENPYLVGEKLPVAAKKGNIGPH